MVTGWIVFFVFLTAILASFVQTTSGFAFALITMALWPTVLTIPDSTHLLMFSSFLVISIMTFRLRHQINFHLVIVPSIVAIAGNAAGVHLVGSAPEALLIKILGAVLIVLAVSLMIAGNRFRIKATVGTASISGLVSGMMNGMFNIPGPPIVLYYSAATRTKEEYIATAQFFFWIALLQRVILVLLSTSLSTDVLITFPFAITGSVIGMVLGFRVFRGLRQERVKQAVYALMIISGVFYLTI